MKTRIFFSGSKGNCTYLSDGETSILVDAGGCLKTIRENLLAVGDRLENIKGIFITHEHSDHTRALYNIAKKYDIKIFTAIDTARAICTPTATYSLDVCKTVAKSVMTVKPSKSYDVGSLSIKTFSTPHDAAASLGFVFESRESGKSLAYATDLGYITDEIEENFLGIKNVIIESNHDVNMLKNGPYPEYLKTRILSEKGHLSNEATADFVKKLAKNGTKSVVLAHLSEENNIPRLALDTVESAVEEELVLQAANPYKATEMEIF
jgi:phosphoribosyl 1,2-cyclic phosphodiesterase